MMKRFRLLGCFAVLLLSTAFSTWLVSQRLTPFKPLLLRGHTKYISSIVFSPDGKLLATGSLDGAVKFWDTSTGVCDRTLTGPSRSIWHLAFSPDGNRLATADISRKVLIWDVGSGMVIKTLSAHIDEVICVEFSPDGKLLATSGHEKVAYIWDIEKGKPIKQFWKHKDWVGPVAFSPDGTTLATGDREKIQTWDVGTGKSLSMTPNPINHWFRYSSDGKRLVTGGIYSGTKVWDTSTWQIVLNVPDSGTRDIDLSKSDQLAVALDRKVKIRDLRTGSIIQTVGEVNGQTKWPLWLLKALPFLRPPPTFSITCVAISSDGKMVAAAGDDFSIRLWRLR
jgi:WD40 repeat protein